MNRPSPATFGSIGNASDADLAETASKILLKWGIPLGSQDQMALEEIVNEFETNNVMAAEHRTRLVEVLQRLIAPRAN